MELTKKNVKELLSLKNLPDSDDIRYKEIIKEKLLENEKLILLLNNKELIESGAEPDEYYMTNIFPYYIIHDSQHQVSNYICYETSFRELDRFNKKVKYQQIIFYILCEQKNNIDTNTYIARHDLLAALIMDQFNWTNYFGEKIHCVSNIPSIVDIDYACRTLIFEQITDNNVVKTRDGIPRMINKEKTYTYSPGLEDNP